MSSIPEINTLPDYMKIPSRTIPSFHSPTGEHTHASSSSSASAWGFPIPGDQSPSATSVMAQDYFVSDATWSKILAGSKFDYIVIGSGCTALAFIDEVLKLDKDKRILCLERGGMCYGAPIHHCFEADGTDGSYSSLFNYEDFWLPSHFQNLPLPFKMVLGGPSETFPWTLSRKTFKTKELGFCHGSCPFFGGRSTFWSAWSPQPNSDLMRGFPKSMLGTTESKDFWHRAKELLHVKQASEIDDRIFASLQKAIDKVLKDKLKDVPHADFVESARLAVGPRSPTSLMRFSKFSVPGPLLALYEEQRKLAEKGEGQPLHMMLNCTVTGLNEGDDGIVRSIETNRGVLAWSDDDTKVVLCAGAIPNATLLLNSFPGCRETVGKRVTGHFLTHIAARCPMECIPGWDWEESQTLQIAATYLAGKSPSTKRQYHVQITAIHSPDPENDADDAARECPDYAAAASYEQLKDSQKHVVFVCASLGELTDVNQENYLQLDGGKDPSTNVKLQFTLHEDDRTLWDVMDTATYATINTMAGWNTKHIEFWDVHNGKWSKEKPSEDSIRIPGIVHEASTAFVGPKEKGGSLDEHYNPHGVHNVFVTGGALFPSAGSWNPTLTMCGFAQDLARKLNTE